MLPVNSITQCRGYCSVVPVSQVSKPPKRHQSVRPWQQHRTQNQQHLKNSSLQIRFSKMHTFNKMRAPDRQLRARVPGAKVTEHPTATTKCEPSESAEKQDTHIYVNRITKRPDSREDPMMGNMWQEPLNNLQRMIDENEKNHPDSGLHAFFRSKVKVASVVWLYL